MDQRAHEQQLRTAGFWRRLVAFGLDGVLVGTAAVLLAFALGLIDVAALPARRGNLFDYAIDLWNAHPGFFLGPLILFAALLALYDAVTVAALGASPGRRALGLRVVAADGSAPAPGRAALRALLRLVSIAACGLGVLWIAATRTRRGWHDLLTGTYVARG